MRVRACNPIYPPHLISPHLTSNLTLIPFVALPFPFDSADMRAKAPAGLMEHLASPAFVESTMASFEVGCLPCVKRHFHSLGFAPLRHA